jgi:predicted nuclease of restriction endonuclease-like (RecB) superfamily
VNIDCENSGWGKNVVKNLADYLSATNPDLEGFSSQNLWRMKQFYEFYKDNEKLSSLLREISWTNNLHILSKTKSLEEKEFYMPKLCMKEKYSARELARQIDSGYFERCMLLQGKISTNITEIYPNVSNMFRDSYVLEFLNLPEKFYTRTSIVLCELKKKS